MDNKRLGIILIIICVVLGGLIFAFDNQIKQQAKESCDCEHSTEGFCSMENPNSWQTYVGIILISLIAALGVYLVFFEKSQKEIISTLNKQNKIQTEKEKFEILLKGLSDEEKKVIKSVKAQDGITQQTLRLRTDLHKSKLSIVLDGLEKKGLIARKQKQKTKQIFFKIKL